LSTGVRVAWVSYADRPPQGLNDPSVYYVLAQRIADGDGYTRPPVAPSDNNPAGFPATPFAYYPLGAATTLLVYVLGRRLFSPVVGLTAGLIHAAYPGQIIYTATLLSEPLFTFLLMLALTLLLWSRPGPIEDRSTWWRLGAGGLLLGAATLTRGITLFLPLVLFVGWWLSSRRPGPAALQAGVVLGGILLLVIPWSIRNTVQLGSPVLISTNIGDDLCIGHHDGAQGKFTLTGPCFDKYAYETTSPEQIEVERNREGVRMALSFAPRHPLREVQLVFDKAYYLLREDRDGLYAVESYGHDPFIPEGRRDSIAYLANLWYYGSSAWALLGAALALLSRDLRRILLCVSIAYILAMPLIFFGDPRFHYPAIPMLAILAGAGIGTLFEAARDRSKAAVLAGTPAPTPAGAPGGGG